MLTLPSSGDQCGEHLVGWSGWSEGGGHVYGPKSTSCRQDHTLSRWPNISPHINIKYWLSHLTMLSSKILKFYVSLMVAAQSSNKLKSRPVSGTRVTVYTTGKVITRVVNSTTVYTAACGNDEKIP